MKITTAMGLWAQKTVVFSKTCHKRGRLVSTSVLSGRVRHGPTAPDAGENDSWIHFVCSVLEEDDIAFAVLAISHLEYLAANET
jgi:hypothetical protein